MLGYNDDHNNNNNNNNNVINNDINNDNNNNNNNNYKIRSVTDISSIKEELKQKIKVKAQRERRFDKRNKFYRQNLSDGCQEIL